MVKPWIFRISEEAGRYMVHQEACVRMNLTYVDTINIYMSSRRSLCKPASLEDVFGFEEAVFHNSYNIAWMVVEI